MTISIPRKKYLPRFKGPLKGQPIKQNGNKDSRQKEISESNKNRSPWSQECVSSKGSGLMMFYIRNSCHLMITGVSTHRNVLFLE